MHSVLNVTKCYVMHTVINATDFVCNVMKSAEMHNNAVPCYRAKTPRISGKNPTYPLPEGPVLPSNQAP